MAVYTTRLTGVGIAALLASTTALVSCGDSDPSKQTPSAAAQAGEAGEHGEGGEHGEAGEQGERGEAGESGEGGEAGEGGEGAEGGEGEGGVSIAAAATDPVVFQSALAIAKAHVIAARDAYAAGEVEAAGEMFAHPASEVLYEMEPVLKARGVEPFSDMFLEASSAVFDGASTDDITQRTQAILANLDAAAEKSPSDGKTPGKVAAGVVADQIDRASDMYRIAKDTGEYGPYLDGYGFYKAARAAYEDSQSDIATDSATLIAIIEDALGKLEQAYPAATLPEDLEEDPALLRAISSRLMLGLS